MRWLLQRGDELGGEQAGLELSGRQIGEIHPVGQLDSGSFQGLNSSSVEYNMGLL